jgi:hypothetical protein
MPYPKNEDAVEQTPCSGGYGRNFLRRVVPPEVPLAHVALSHLIRCVPKWRKDGDMMPSGGDRKALTVCRQYDDMQHLNGVFSDGGIRAWKPDTAIMTFAPYDMVKGPAFIHLLKNDVAKAFRLADAGARPAVIFGREVGELVYPRAFKTGAGGLKVWRGHVIYPFDLDKFEMKGPVFRRLGKDWRPQ